MADQTEDLAAVGEQGNPDQEASQRPSWLPENFESEEAFAKSYKELERSFHETRTQLKAQQEQFEEFLAEQQAAQSQQVQQQQVDQFAAAYADAMEQGDYQRAWQINQAAETQRLAQVAQAFQTQGQQGLPQEFVADYADKTMAAQYEDWQTYRVQAADLLQENQDMIPLEAVSNPAALAKVLDLAYKAVKGEALLQNPQLAQPDLSQQKMAAQTMAGAGQRQPNPSSDEEWARQIAEANKGLNTSLFG